MAPYLQTNEQGYIVCTTNESLLSGLFGGSPKNFRKVSDEVAKVIKIKKDSGTPVHISEVSGIEEKIRQLKKGNQ